MNDQPHPSFENRWTHEDTIKKYDVGGRNLFRPANSELVRRYFKMNIKPGDKIFEIGSGLGELTKLVPEYKLIQTEQNKGISRANKKACPDTNIIIANAYNLPFPNKDFDVAVGYSMLDTLSEPSRAFQELYKVLKTGGKVIHFLDMEAAPYPLLDKYKESGFKLVPYQGKDGSGVRLIPVNEWKDFINKVVPPSFVGMLELFAKDSTYAIEFLSSRDSEWKVLSAIGKSADKAAPQSQVIEYNDFFISQVTDAAKQNGFSVLKSERQPYMIEVPREAVYAQKPEVNFYDNNLGKISLSHLENIESDKVLIASTMHVFIAQKS